MSGKRKKHGLYKHRLYYIWTAMLKRCNNPKYPSYKYYGGRGIKVCKRWHNVKHFIADMNDSYSEGLAIDRINNDGDYKPSNCRWVTPKENARNRSSNAVYSLNGKTQCVADWADEYGFKVSTIYKRLKKGWSIKKALTTPLMR